MSWLGGHATHESADPEEHAGRSRWARLRRSRASTTSSSRPRGRRWTTASSGSRPRRVSWRRGSRPAARPLRAGVREGDVLLAVDGEEALSPAPSRELPSPAGASGSRLHYSLLREDERRALDVVVQPLPTGQRQRVLLPVAGRLLQPRRRHRGAAPPARRPDVPALLRGLRAVLPAATPSPTPGSSARRTGSSSGPTRSPALFLPVVFLHFCLTFPERRLRAQRTWLVPALYMPALVIAGATATSHALVAAGEEPGGALGHRRGPRPGGAALLRRSSSPSPSRSCSTPIGARGGSPRAGR